MAITYEAIMTDPEMSAHRRGYREKISAEIENLDHWIKRHLIEKFVDGNRKEQLVITLSNVERESYLAVLKRYEKLGWRVRGSWGNGRPYFYFRPPMQLPRWLGWLHDQLFEHASVDPRAL